jgi:hypothetical protein
MERSGIEEMAIVTILCITLQQLIIYAIYKDCKYYQKEMIRYKDMWDEKVGIKSKHRNFRIFP